MNRRELLILTALAPLAALLPEGEKKEPKFIHGGIVKGPLYPDNCIFIPPLIEGETYTISSYYNGKLTEEKFTYKDGMYVL